MTTTDTQPQDSPESPNRIWIEIYREGYPVPTEFYTHEIPHSIEYVRAAVAGPRGDESGWLLEKMYEGNVHYICADNILQWTDDPNKALRLARREDAEALTTIVEDCEKIAEHEWVPPAATSSPTPAEGVGPRSNLESHPYQQHPYYPNYCAFAVGDEDYCKREPDNVIHQVSAPAERARVEGEQLGHVDHVFDNMPCCKVCGLVRPAEGWTRPCKGPHGISVRDTADSARRAAWADAGGHAWEIRSNVECVECPHCAFTFAAMHTVAPEDYDCPNCEGCPDAVAPADNDAELLLQHVAYSGVEFDDNRMGYVVVQIDRDVWEQIKKLAPTTTKGDR